MQIKSIIDHQTPTSFRDAQPNEADVVIIGGGIIGISAAFYLAESGKKVFVCEKGRVAGEQSSRNWGWVRQTGRDAAELPIMIESLQIWKGLAAKTGENALTFSEQGVMYISQSEEETQFHREFVELAKQHNVDSKLLSASEVANRFPAASDKWKNNLHSGLWTASDGRVEPWHAVPALARAAQRVGAEISENCAAIEIESSAGKISAVRTENGVIKTNNVLLAGGIWSSQMVRRSGIYLPQLCVKATVARLENTPELFTGNTADAELAVAQRLDGGYTMALSDFQEHYITPDSFRFLRPFLAGAKKKIKSTRFHIKTPDGYPDKWTQPGSNPFQALTKGRILDPKADPAVVDKMLRFLRSQFDGCESANVSDAWAGMIDTMPDFVPTMDHASKIPGLFIATGFSGHGFGIGPGAGRVMADLINGKNPDHDISRFKLSRFTDGSVLELGPT